MGEIVEFTEEGVTVKERYQKRFTDTEKEVEVENVGWDDFPEGDMMMVVTRVKPHFNEREDSSLHMLRFETEKLELNQSNEISTTEDIWAEIEENLGISKTNDNIELNDSWGGKENLIKLSSFLFENGYLTKDDLPLAPPQAWKRYLLNTEPVHQDGDQMTKYREEVEEGVYLETNHDNKSLRNQIRFLGDFVEQQ